ncbi:hypothetical protein AB0B78_40155, partial [Streptomyces sp. NPDC040724]
MDPARTFPAGGEPGSTARKAPPLDPELSAALAALGDAAREPFTPENLADRQERDAASRPRPTLRELRAEPGSRTVQRSAGHSRGCEVMDVTSP